jgi:hypothetical protein
MVMCDSVELFCNNYICQINTLTVKQTVFLEFLFSYYYVNCDVFVFKIIFYFPIFLMCFGQPYSYQLWFFRHK